jgi:HEAT repeat protein
LVIRGLQRLGGRAAAAAAELRRASEDDYLSVQFAALVALAEVEPVRAGTIYGELLEVLAGASVDKTSQVQLALLRTGPAGLPQLVQALDSPNLETVRLVVELLLALHGEHADDMPERGDPHLPLVEVMKALHTAENHPDERVREIFRRTLLENYGPPGGGIRGCIF